MSDDSLETGFVRRKRFLIATSLALAAAGYLGVDDRRGQRPWQQGKRRPSGEGRDSGLPSLALGALDIYAMVPGLQCVE